MEIGGGNATVEYHRRAADPDLSVVVATIPSNSHAEVCRHLREQSYDGDWEVIVVDDAGLNRSEARNVGLRRAAADIVAFTDDDTKPPADWLPSIKRAFHANPDLVCLEGRVTGGSHYSGTGYYVGCNMAVDRAAALEVGGWRSEFAGWREDTEFGWRMEKRANGECAYVDDVVMVHPSLPRTGYDERKERKLRATHPDLYAERVAGDPVKRGWLALQRVGVARWISRIRNSVSPL